MTHSPKKPPKSMIRVARELHGWSQKDLALRVGTMQSTVSSWERQINHPIPYYCDKLSQVLEKSIEELGLYTKDWEDSQNPSDSSSPQEPTVSDNRPLDSSPASREQSALVFWNIPYPRDSFFTGRESILEGIHTTLNRSDGPLTIVSLTGLAGVGKTHIAAEYAYRFRAAYQSIFWIAADNLLPEMRRLASVLMLPEKQEADAPLVIYAVRQWFHLHTNWLLVFDNVEDMKALYDVIPQDGNGHIVLTTTLPAAGFITKSVEIPPLNLKEGTTFLLRRTKQIAADKALGEAKEEERENARAIAEEMDGLSLALDQAAAYIEETPCTMGDYLHHYRSRRAVFLNRRGWSSTTHHLSLATALSLSFEKAQQQLPAAVELLRLCAFLHADDIPEEMITEGVLVLTSSLREVADPCLFEEAVGVLRRYALIRYHREKKTLSLHRLVQIVLKEGMEEAHQRDWAQQAVALVSHILPPFDFASWNRFQRYSTQAQSCLAWVDTYQIPSRDAVQLLVWVGEYLGETSPTNNKESEPLLQRAAALAQTLESGDPVRGASMNALAVLYFNQARYQEAEQLLLEIIEQSKHDPGLDRATCLNNLGEVYYAQARYVEAEPLFHQALDLRIVFEGAEAPSVAMSLLCLAQLYAVQEKYEEAEPLFERSLQIREQALGSEHVAVADTLEGWAELYVRWRKPRRASPLYQRALEISKKLEGPMHPNVARCLRGLGETYLIQERFEEAEALLLEALAIYDRDEGEIYPDKAQILKDLAWVYVYGQERFTEAEPLLQEALTIRRKLLGIHPDTATSCLDLGRYYGRMSNYPKAEPYYREALSVYRQTLDANHSLVKRVGEEYQMLLAGM